MSKNLRLVCLFLILVQSVVGLKCFFGDTSNSTFGHMKQNISEIQKLEDCRGVTGTKLYKYLRHYNDDDLRCFIFVGYKSGIQMTMRKGCIGKDECKEMSSLFKNILDSNTCYECDEDGCNTGNSASKYAAFGLIGFLLSSVTLFLSI